MKKIFPKVRQNKNFRQIKSRRLHGQQICTVSSVKAMSSGRTKMLPDGNLDPHKQMKSTTKVGSYKAVLIV